MILVVVQQGGKGKTRNSLLVIHQGTDYQIDIKGNLKQFVNRTERSTVSKTENNGSEKSESRYTFRYKVLDILTLK